MMEVRRIFVPLLALAVCCVVCQSQSTYRFTENNYDGYEGSQRVSVRIERTGNTDGSGSVRITTFASTASAGGDYNSLNLVVDFPPGQEHQTVDVDLIEDADDDEGETFTVRLSDPTGGEVGSPSQAVVAIHDGEAPTTGLEEEVLIAIIVACVAAVLILLICCLLIYCLRFRNSDPREDVVYIRKPVPDEPEMFLPPPQPRPYTPPLQRPYTPPLAPSFQGGDHRPRTPPPVHVGNGNTQVMVINEPSPPIIEPPPPKPTQVIVIRPQTPEVIRRRPQPVGQTEVIVNRERHRPRSASPILIEELDDRPPSPVSVVRRAIRRPRPTHDGDRFRGRDGDRFRGRDGDRFRRSFRGRDGDRFGLLDRDYGFGNFYGDGFGGRDSLLNLQPGLGLYGPSNPSVLGRGPGLYDSRLPTGSFGPGFGSPGAFLPPPGLGPSGFMNAGFDSGFGGASRPPPGFGSAFGRPPPVFGPPPPPSGFYGQGF